MSQEFSYPTVSGVGFAGYGRVLVRNKRAALIWFAGGSAYINRMTGSVYAAAQMVIVRDSMSCVDNYSNVHEGGRLKPELFVTYAEKIDKEFGEGTAAKLKVDETLALVEKPWFRLYPPERVEEKRNQRKVAKAAKARRMERHARRLELPDRREFTEEDLRAIHARFAMSNDPEGMEVARKADALIRHIEFNRS